MEFRRPRDNRRFANNGIQQSRTAEFVSKLSRPTLTQFNPYHDSNAVFVGGTYAGSDPDPNVRAALIREFGRRGM
jgi:hypothetical protein